MLLVTVELFPFGREDGRKSIGQTRVINVAGDAAYGSYLFEVFEGAETPIATSLLTDYPRFAGSVWDLVARGVIAALSGKEELPPRPVHPWRKGEEWK
ncbi:hypothetical protein [Caballeronia novacaledonica]|uniref:hypothetical protein n=1 Tax=Caballeronia novacaledonica TaxID=1544861 RepID=UPI000D119413|nr:hypothetical protein [Caballeronia novacaledonica]